MDSHYNHQPLNSTAYPPKSLPQELLIFIIEHAWTRDRSAVSDMRSFSLVSSSWRPVAQRRLFKNVTLPRVSNVEKFLNSIQGSGELGEATRSLELRSLWSDSDGRSDRALRALIRNITSLCPRLYSISISLWSRTPRDGLLNLFDPHTFQNLKSLSFSLDSPWPDTNPSPQLTLYDVLDFFNQFHSLKHLNLPGPMMFSAPEEITFPSPPSFRLYELVFGAEQFEWEACRLVFEWMLAGENASELRVFYMDDGEEQYTLDDAVWTPLLRLHGANLLSFRIIQDPVCLEDSEIPLSNFCPNLRELGLPNSDLPPQIRMCIPTSDLEHLVFATAPEYRAFGGGDEDIVEEERKELGDLVDWILQLPKIRHVTLCLDGGITPRYPDIWKRCKLRDIGLQFMDKIDYINHIRTFPEDMVVASHFPRYDCRVPGSQFRTDLASDSDSD
ncbi:hypothetical protein FRC03_009683 [Tulasnella sp. 419]|nr:hypothetical protein FRC03_009683 [Tulasnella sp. 419]